MDGRNTLMIPNLRFNKNITRKLLSSKAANTLSSASVRWHVDNTPDNTYGTYCDSWFKTYIFIIQPGEGNTHRLVVLHNKGLYGIYLIENLDVYLKYIPSGLINEDIGETLRKALDELKDMPNSGILEIDNESEEIFLYDHKNY